MCAVADVQDLYETDVFAWSMAQAELLRRFAETSGSKPNVESPDWKNIIEEIESVRRSEVRAVESHLIQAMRHELKILGWPDAVHVGHWQAEVRFHRYRAHKLCRPSMQALDLDELYESARLRIASDVDGVAGWPLPARCPWTLRDLLTHERALPSI